MDGNHHILSYRATGSSFWIQPAAKWITKCSDLRLLQGGSRPQTRTQKGIGGSSASSAGGGGSILDRGATDSDARNVEVASQAQSRESAGSRCASLVA
mmetsp:Transcript_16858/g.36281  ORF Transcript_16858/g.36281 Transcript_16858/m.36281 type:complete len:98 (+) Transcript_16858:110-403(+)